MRFMIEYKDFRTKEEQNKSLILLDTFLNEHLIGEFHGKTFECILIRFINHAPPKKKYKLKSFYKIIAEVEVEGQFSENIKINIADFQQGLSKVEQAIKLVPEIEMKEKVDFDKDRLLATLKRMINAAPQTDDDLKYYAREEKKISCLNNVKRVDSLIYSCKISPKPLVKRIVGVRIYDHFERNTLSPYDYIYSELFSNLLRNAEVKLPDYEEIYFSIGETMEQAKQEIALEVEKIEAVIEEIATKGMDMELTYATAQNKDYLVEVIYQVPLSHVTKAEYKLRLTEIRTKRTGIVSIDKLTTYYAPYSLGKIQIKKNEVIIKGRNSVRAGISREIDKYPSEYRFRINEVIGV
ncbi:hypothetical protein [Sutcliffiella horikoshii]|uniref:hypothetical protein n=1 Tax=Sutcliffiella horikoshii TaxID=79883 RepID=UPI00384D43E6